MEQLSTLGIPIVTVLVEGRPRLLSDVSSLSSAIVHSFVPGPMGGQAVAEVLYGKYSPNGRMPYTYPRNPADIGYTYAHKVEDKCDSSTNAFSTVPCNVRFYTL